MTIEQIVAALTALLALPAVPKAVAAIRALFDASARAKVDEVVYLRAEVKREREEYTAAKAELRKALDEAEDAEYTLTLEVQRLTAALERSLADRDHARHEVDIATGFVDAMLDRKK